MVDIGDRGSSSRRWTSTSGASRAVGPLALSLFAMALPPGWEAQVRPPGGRFAASAAAEAKLRGSDRVGHQLHEPAVET